MHIMKTLILALTILAGFVASPSAEAGQFQRIHTRHGVQYINKYSGYDASYYNLHNRSHCDVPSHRSYRTSHWSHRNHNYRSANRHQSRPRFSVSFGF